MSNNYKQINLGSQLKSVTWIDVGSRTIYYRAFSKMASAISWLADNMDKVVMTTVTLKHSGNFSIRNGYRLVEYNSLDIVFDNGCIIKPVKVDPVKRMLEKPKEKVFVCYQNDFGLLRKRECTEETKMQLEKDLIEKEKAMEIRTDEWSIGRASWDE